MIENPTSIQLYTTNQISAITGVTAPRIHQMRNGQTVKIKTTGKIYDIKPYLEKGVHWTWKDTEVVFFPIGLEKILARRKRALNKVKVQITETQFTEHV
jgi:hypothetical protein